MLVFAASITCISANALDNGIYLADCTPHYAHPTTGVIEDSGGDGSSVLGQSMTESATYEKALIEVDTNGNMYATIRFKLMDNIQNPTFKVQNNGNSGFYNVDYDVMKEDYSANTSDFRIQIPNENCIVRCTFYVIAMGRDVIFYIDFSNLVSGSGDFVTSVQVTQATTITTQAVTAAPQSTTAAYTEQTQTAADQGQSDGTENQNTTTTKSVNDETDDSDSADDSSDETDSAAESASDDSSSETDTSSDTSSSLSSKAAIDADGIVCFDENGNEIDPMNSSDSGEKDSSSESKSENTGSGSGIAVPVIIAGAVVVGGGAGGFVFWRRRRLM